MDEFLRRLLGQDPGLLRHPAVLRVLAPPTALCVEILSLAARDGDWLSEETRRILCKASSMPPPLAKVVPSKL